MNLIIIECKAFEFMNKREIVSGMWSNKWSVSMRDLMRIFIGEELWERYESETFVVEK